MILIEGIGRRGGAVGADQTTLRGLTERQLLEARISSRSRQAAQAAQADHSQTELGVHPPSYHSFES